MAVTSKFAACWSGDQPLGSQFQIRGGLVADFSNPPFRTFLTGTVRQIAITSNSSKLGERNGREAWHPDGPWELQDVPVAPAHVRPPQARRHKGASTGCSFTWS